MLKFSKYLSCLTLLAISTQAHGQSSDYPCLTMINETSSSLLIEDDPNWDDQQLVVNGEIKNSLLLQLNQHKSAKICGLWNQFGIDIHPEGNFVALTILNDDGSKVTKFGNIFNTGSFNYQVLQQTLTQLTVKVQPA